MHRITTLLMVVGLVMAAGAQKKKPAERGESKNSISMTGCIDEEAGARYILLNVSDLRKKADLEASGFRNESFAKYLGHRVEVKGTLSESQPPVFKVREIRRISEFCSAPQ